jgi:hypothetical protein
MECDKCSNEIKVCQRKFGESPYLNIILEWPPHDSRYIFCCHDCLVAWLTEQNIGK